MVQNLNVQSDASDLLGGFRPLQVRQLAFPLYNDFVALFPRLFSKSRNADFLRALAAAFEGQRWVELAKGMAGVLTTGEQKVARNPTKWAKVAAPWADMKQRATDFATRVQSAATSFSFAFVEGMLVKAIRAGHWVLLDEINLAAPETLQRLSGLLEGAQGALAITERGDLEGVPRHPNFRLFAAMNPPTDVGKKDLPPALRNRFTEVCVVACAQVPSVTPT